ncbi:MAG: 3,4-dihydroxy-2-butanone-4-phosphate synthase [Rhodospirillaceae bacterium]|nr:3,4-dihydroxy-2-butanone-4-phosphate synthase [Rhodospirillaceae bacterium]OUT79959.1 MAG: 3,4-dihydroxy-2-butanone-4-phosphate synthase [Rhodospirillaceae bacterium TMED23]|tara:strand:+ start:25447 stop:26598 length:1152 start_codon:yes stop_codon:yes gene_type:complete
MLSKNNINKYLSTIDEIIDEARNGRMFILVDDEDRENEGDLVIPAQMATPDAINFMATYGRGLICLTLSQKRIRELGLPAMISNNKMRHQTAFTISIEAKEGVTTGISAADRARTIATAIDSNKGSEDISSPGHIFPLAARDGGVLVRTGHTEASVDISRLAGLAPGGVICEIMKDDGSMARLPDLVDFAQRHNLKVATIADLIKYRLKNDRIVKASLTSKLKTISGRSFESIVFVNQADGSEHLALTKGEIKKDVPTLVRMHSINIFDDIYSADKILELHKAIEMIDHEGSGAVVMLQNPSPTIISERLKINQEETQQTFRGYGIGAQILLELGINQMIVLSNTEQTLIGLEGYGLTIAERRAIKLSKDSIIPVRNNFYEQI